MQFALPSEFYNFNVSHFTSVPNIMPMFVFPMKILHYLVDFSKNSHVALNLKRYDREKTF